MAYDLSDLLAPCGLLRSIGSENVFYEHDGIVVLEAFNKLSYRYKLYVDGRLCSVLQIVTRDGYHGKAARAFTLADCRRKGYASKLLKQALRDFKVIEAADDLSKDGAAFTKKNWGDRKLIGEGVDADK